jgi:hypothetical protein
MKPIYFPFTYVPGWVAKALAACLKQFVVYQPAGRKVPHEMQLWVDAQMMEIRVPVRKDDQALKAVIGDFRAFADRHHDSKELKTAAFWGQHGSIPFFGESSALRIVADLKKGVGSNSVQMDPNPLFGARVFLEFAQEFDRQHDELNRALNACDQRADDLLKNLMGDYEFTSSTTTRATAIEAHEPAEYMAFERLQAWIQLFREDPVGAWLFVTSSKSVFNHLVGQRPAAAKIIESEVLPADGIKDDAFNTQRNRFLKYLNQLVETNWSASKDVLCDISFKSGAATTVSLTVCLVPGQTPWDFFAQFGGFQHSEKITPDQTGKLKNTLIGLIERKHSTLSAA